MGQLLIWILIYIISTTTNTKRLTLDSTNAAGSSFLTLKCKNSFQSSLFLNATALSLKSETADLPMHFVVTDGTTNYTPIRITGNTVVHIGNNTANNKVLSLFDQGSADLPSTATNFLDLVSILIYWDIKHQSLLIVIDSFVGVH